MTVQIERPSLFECTLQATVPAADVDARLREKALKLSRQVNLRGFRPGKVPLGVVERQFWDHLRPELETDLLQDALREADEAQTLALLAEPAIETAPLVKGADFSFTIKLLVRPTLDVQGLDSLSARLEPLAIGDDDVEGALTQMREQSAERVPVDQAAGEGLFAMIDASLKDGDADYLGPLEEVPIEIGRDLVVPGFDAEVTGMKAGDEKDFTLTVGHDDHQHTLTCHVKVREVLRKTLPAIDAAFLDKVGFETEDELRADVRQRLAMESDAMRKRALKDVLLATLIEANPMDVPAPLVARLADHGAERFKREMAMYGRGGDDMEAEIAQLRPRFEEEATEGLKRQVILESLATTWEIEVGDDDLAEHFRKVAEDTGMNVARIRSFYEDEERQAQLLASLRQGKVQDRLLELAVENAARAAAEGTPAAGDAPAADASEAPAEKPKKPREKAAKKDAADGNDAGGASDEQEAE